MRCRFRDERTIGMIKEYESGVKAKELYRNTGSVTLHFALIEASLAG